MVTCLGQIYGLKLLDPTDPTSWIRTAPYSAFEKITNVQNQLRLNDAYNSYISTPNGNRFDFIVDPDTQNTFFTFAGSLI
ncbi:hypothetical protein FACS1894166_02170 [Bacilli bacterium]|nr:hypothetical protein FACS1894166_02170 [Bacilli bacterium]